MKMKQIKNIVSWVLAVFFFISALVFMPSLAMVLFALIGIALLPIKPINNLWDKMPKRKVIKPISIIVLSFIALIAVPTSTTTSADNEAEAVVESSFEETVNEETTEVSIALVEETQTESETQIETSSTNESSVEEVSEIESAAEKETTEVEENKKDPDKETNKSTDSKDLNKDNKEQAKEPEVEVESKSEPQSEVESEPAPQPEVKPEPVPEPQPEVIPEPAPQPAPTGSFAVNNANGKIHMVGHCSATGSGDNAMTNPIYFGTYEEAEAYSIQINPKQSKRKCGNCWK